MRIVEVSVWPVVIPAARPAFRWRDGLLGSPDGDGTGAVLVITTEDGVQGRAFDPHGAIVGDIARRLLAEALVGRDAADRELLWHAIWELDRIEELPIYALGLVDVALWDMAGRRAGLPVHELMGTFRRSIAAYASTTTFATVGEFLEVADQCLERGFTAIKLHAWGDARRDAELACALREHVGDKVELMYDGSAGFDLADAVYLGRALGDAGYRWYEEPMREFSITAYRWLSERVSIPLLVGETSDGAHYNMGDFVASGCATYVRTSARYKGGLTGALRIAHLADAFRLRAEVHGGGPESRHLCMAIANTTYYESLVTSNPIVTEDCIGPDGAVVAPTEPGVGLPDVVEEQLDQATRS
ncbi:enolase C-terminal domain-like protein [Kribbella soli]|uniref:Racemase n=1 Tax=Kribbella soli TaxID=1124743 RepID=A0A4R0H003_9ACTN|nr:enolase C-terminal domain-like protein [Kribbella soli]TCC02474.1 racemase [Kribbella soli]